MKSLVFWTVLGIVLFCCACVCGSAQAHCPGGKCPVKIKPAIIHIHKHTPVRTAAKWLAETPRRIHQRRHHAQP